MSEAEKSIRNQDYSHAYTTSVEHVLALYHEAIANNLEKILELGSYKGISTVGLAYAARDLGGFVCAVDLCDEMPNSERVRYWQSIKPPVMRYIFPYKASAMEFLASNECQYDLIFHDAQHGNQSIPELHMAWNNLSKRGVLAIHDYEQITNKGELLSLLKTDLVTKTADDRGRELAFISK